jgi:hypothetical protein
MFREIVDKNLRELMVKPSIAKVKSSCMDINSSGILICLSIGNGLRLVVLPLTVPTSGPKMCSTRSTFFVVTGLYCMRFVQIAPFKFNRDGHPRE